MEIYVAISLAAAAIFALEGTNAQARLSRERLLNDEDPLIAEAGRRWHPGPLWLALPRQRRARAEAEAAVRIDPARWDRYLRLRRELSAWNLLESSVALASVASVIVAIGALFG